MTNQVLVSISDEAYEQFRWFAHWTNRDIADVVADSINYPAPKLNPQVYPPVEQLSDTDVLALAESQMMPEAGERLSELSYKQQAEPMSAEEHAELMALLEIYQIGLVRKSQGLREAVQRGLMKRLDE